MRFDSAKGRISYPYTDKQTEKMDVEIVINGNTKNIGGFQWFVENKGMGTDKQSLMKAGENEAKLPYLEVLPYGISKKGSHKQNKKKGNCHNSGGGRKGREKRK